MATKSREPLQPRSCLEIRLLWFSNKSKSVHEYTDLGSCYMLLGPNSQVSFLAWSQCKMFLSQCETISVAKCRTKIREHVLEIALPSQCANIQPPQRLLPVQSHNRAGFESNIITSFQIPS